MAKFKSYVGKQVRIPRGVLLFKKEELETDDKDHIERLQKAKDVVEVKGGGQASSKQKDKD
jgi:hypothetical protein